MDESTEARDILLLFGTTLFFSCIEHADLVEIKEETAEVLKETKTDHEQQNTLSVKSFVKDKAIEMYAKKALEDVRRSLKHSQPLLVGSMDKEKIKESDIEVTFQLKNIKLFNLYSFQVTKFKSMSEQNSCEFSLEIPFIKALANYDVTGTFKGKKVNGRGDSEINITGVSIEDGKIVVKETPEEIQISSLNMCYDFKDLVIKQSGLNIEGLQHDEVTNFLNESGKKYLRDNKRKICDRVTKELKTRANAKLKGKNREQLMDMMKKT